MNTKPKKYKDQPLYTALVAAQKAKLIEVTVDANRLNHPGSPVWNAGENVAPLLAPILISVLLMFIANEFIGLAALILTVFVYFALIRPWILGRVYFRALDAALQKLHNWDLLWKKGGLAISLSDPHGPHCRSPEDDWRTFVARHLPMVEVAGTEIYKDFKRAEQHDADLKEIKDLNTQF